MFAMRALFIVILLLLTFSLPVRSTLADLPAQVTQEALVILGTPLPGQALQGVVVITGNTAVPGFAGAELAFSYADDPTDTWFLIATSTAPVENGPLADWDTSTITDGDYTLRLTVTFADTTQISLSVTGLRVRNYTSIETDTPTPPPPSATPLPGTPLPPTASPTATALPSATLPPPTPTPLPTNPAVLSLKDIGTTLGTGAGIGIGGLGLLGLYLYLRQTLRNRY